MTIEERLKAVRAATRLTQSDFARELDRTASRMLGPARVRYDQPLVSSLERGSRAVTLDEIAIYAAVDPLHRGKVWLGWGERRDSSLGGSDEQLAAQTGGQVLAPLPSLPPAPSVGETVRRRRPRRAGGD